jgi:hypothetical protein
MADSATRWSALGVALALAGCGGSGTDGRGDESAAAGNGSAAPAGPRIVAAVLTPQGLGPLRIGMSRAEVVKTLGEDSDPDAVGGPDPESCDEFRPARAPKGMLVMIEAGRLTRISVTEGTGVTTDRSLAVGAPASAVRAAYGDTLRSGPHKYEAPPAGYLTAWATDAPKDERGPAPTTARGIRYEVGTDGKVKSVSAGGPSIEYVEGCA